MVVRRQRVNNELPKFNIDIAALQKTPLKSGIQKFDNVTLFNSGSEKGGSINHLAYFM